MVTDSKKKDTDVLSDDLTASSFSKPRSGETFGSFDRQLARGMALGTKHYRVDKSLGIYNEKTSRAVSYTHLRAHETCADLVCRLLLEKKKT